MSALVKKEIRLLLPSFLIGIALTFANFFYKEDELGFNALASVVSIVACSGIAVFTALNSFGAEISAGTFSLLLAQPVSRHRIWRTKTLLLAAALFIGGLLWCAILYLRFELFHHQKVLGHFSDILLGTWLFLLVIYSGALWTVLLLRQMAAAFWFTLLAPGVVLGLIVGLWPEKYSAASEPAAVTGLLIYSLAGFWFGRRLFLRAQDVAWTGGVISLPEWKFFAAHSVNAVSTRNRKPIFALLKKELQLHQVSLLGASVLLALHIFVIVLRKYALFAKDSPGEFLTSFFWMLWLVMPVIIGSMAVAEERRLGVMEGQLCLPVSRRVQFAIKSFQALILGTFLGGAMPILLEGIAIGFGAPDPMFHPGPFGVILVESIATSFGTPHSLYMLETHLGPFGVLLYQLPIMPFSALLVLTSFFASTLARSFPQAVGLAIATFFISSVLLIAIGRTIFRGFGFMSVYSFLPIVIAVPTIIVTLLWLAYLNFKNFRDGWPLWRRNILGILGAFIFIIVASITLYNRVWEVFEPAEPAHGPSKFSLSKPPVLRLGGWECSQVQLPDGRVWVFSGPQRFIAGSNWVSVVDMSSQVIGIRADGSLWLSDRRGNQMTRLGYETNWQKTAIGPGPFVGYLLLKNDGTLWHLAIFDPSKWDHLPALKLTQVGADSNWKELFNTWNGDGDWPGYARKVDGSVWTVRVQVVAHGQVEVFLQQETNLEQLVFHTLSFEGNGVACVCQDGTLWVGNDFSSPGKHRTMGFRFLQAGKESNWLAVAVSYHMMVALKSDGSLWQWNYQLGTLSEAASSSPTRLGIHNDWVAIAGRSGEIIALAADGSLWLWPDRKCYDYQTLLKPPKQPQLLGNIFGKAD